MESTSTAGEESHSARSTRTERPINVAPGLPPLQSPSLGTAPLPQQDSAYFSSQSAQDGEVSDLSPDLQARQLRARERLEILRGRVFRTRHIIRSKRDELRYLREAALDAGDKLTRKISEIVAFAEAEALKSVKPYYEQLRLAQDALGPREEEYSHLESRLDDEEQDLEQEEDHFYRHNYVSEVTVEDSKLDQVISPLVKPYQPPEPEVPDLELNAGPLKTYFRKVAQAEQLKEELDELDYNYYRRSRDASYRTHKNVPISIETRNFLREYPEIHTDSLDYLHEIEDEIYDLRVQCLRQALFTESDHVYEARDTLYEEWMDSVDEALDRSPLRGAVRRLEYHEQTKDFADKREYVNKWLLQWVQDSAYETLRLRTFITSHYPPNAQLLTDDIWSDLALEHWDSDDAGKLATQSFQASKMDTITGDGGNQASTARRTGFSGSFSDMGSMEVDLDEDATTGSDMGDHTSQRQLFGGIGNKAAIT